MIAPQGGTGVRDGDELMVAVRVDVPELELETDGVTDGVAVTVGVMDGDAVHGTAISTPLGAEYVTASPLPS